MLGYGRNGGIKLAHLCSLLTISPRSPASLESIHTSHSNPVTTETLANIYIEVDSISRRNSPNFRFFGVLFLTQHHWIEGAMVCKSFLISYLVLLPSNCELIPALEPEFAYPAKGQHITFTKAMHYLKYYLEGVCGFQKSEKSRNRQSTDGFRRHKDQPPG